MYSQPLSQNNLLCEIKRDHSHTRNIITLQVITYNFTVNILMFLFKIMMIKLHI